MPMIGGINYSYAELSAKCGISKSTLKKRYRKNPNISLNELTREKRPGRPKTRTVTVEGKNIPLLEWADMNGCPRNTVLTYWQRGIRDPYKLVSNRRVEASPEQGVCDISEDNISWLKETRYARRGMPNEWEIACELVGLSTEYTETVRMALEGA